MIRTAVAVRHVPFEDLGLLAPLLARRGFDVTYLDAGVDAITGPVLEDADVVVVLGGPIGVDDAAAYPFLRDETDAIRARLLTDRPTLGICLGAQLLAAACGGHVQVAAPPGREAEIVDVRWRDEAATDRLLAGLAAAGRTAPLPSMHADAIVDLPRGAVWLGSSTMYPYQAFRLGSAWGLQFHPEAGAATLREWAESYDDVDTAAVMAAFDAREPEISAAGRAIATGFAAIVRRAVASQPTTGQPTAGQSGTRSSASMIV